MLARRSSTLTPLEEEVADLRDLVHEQAERIAELEEAIRQRDETFAPTIMFPSALGLTETESTLLAALWTSRAPYVRREALTFRLWGDTPEIDPKGLGVLVHHLRRKLAPVEVTIATYFAQGFALTRVGREKLASLLDPEAAVDLKPLAKRRLASKWAWTKPQDAILRAGYARGATNKQISGEMKARGFLPRGASTLVARANALGITRVKPRQVWSEAEDAIVRAGVEQARSHAEIALDLRRAGFLRGPKAVGAYKVRVGYAQPHDERWSAPEEGIVRDGVRRGMEDRAISDALRSAGHDRTPAAVGNYRRKRGIMKERHRWEPRHDDELRALCAAGVRQFAAARQLGFHSSVIWLRSAALGLRWTDAVPWDETAVAALTDCASRGLTIAEAAREIGRPFGRTSAKARSLGLRFRLDYGAEAKRRPARTSTTEAQA